MTARGQRQAGPEMRNLSIDRTAEFLILHIIIHQYSYHMYYFRNQVYTHTVSLKLYTLRTRIYRDYGGARL